MEGPQRRGGAKPSISERSAADASASVARAMVWFSCTGMRAVCASPSGREEHRAAVAEEALVDREAGLGPLDLAALGLAPELPGDLADLGDRLGRHGLAEAGEPAARVHRDAPADRRVAVVQQLLGLARLAEPDVLVPVELERGGEVVDLGEAQLVGTDAGLLVGGGRDRVAEGELGRRAARRPSRWRSSASR